MHILSKKGLVAGLFFFICIAFAQGPDYFKEAASEDAIKKAEQTKKDAETKKIAAEAAKKKVAAIKEEKKARSCTSTCEINWNENQKKKIAEAEEEAVKKSAEAEVAAKIASDADAVLKKAQAEEKAALEETAKIVAAAEAVKKAEEEAARKAAAEEAAKIVAAAEIVKKAEEEARKALVADSIAKAFEVAKKAEEARKAAVADSIAKAQEAIRIAEEARKAAVADSIAKAQEAARIAEEAKQEAIRKAEEARKAAIADSIAKAQAEEAKRIAELSPDMIFVKGSGLATLGCTKEQGADCNDDERPHQNVTLNDFYISKSPITQKQWEKVMGNNPSRFKACGGNCPVETVSWIEIQEFIRKLNSMTGKRYRLLTEAEWEYAARGGGSTKNQKYSGSNDLNQIAWYGANSRQKTQPVCSKQPNELGLCDMTGNVWEWVQDWRGSYPTASGLKSNPKGPTSGTNRVYRGCSWQDNATHCRVSRRNGAVPETRNSSVGFRLALDK